MLINSKKFDWILLTLLILILCSGVFVIYSASTTKIGNDYHTESYYMRQLIWVLVSLVLFILLLLIPHSIIDFLITPFYILSILLLILVLFMPEIKGSHRWINFGAFNLQPSELAKLATILILAKFLSKPYISDSQILIRAFPLVLLPFGLIMLEPDLGTSLTFIAICFSVLYFSDLQFFFILLIISPILSIITSISPFLFVIYIVLLIYLLYRSKLSPLVIGFTAVINSFIFFITPVLWDNLKHYQQNRILTFLDPLRDPFGAGYQIIQSKIAVGSGGFLGKGFLQGTQKNLNFLPEHHTDFVFSVIGEEFGFLGCIFILLLFFLFLYRLVISVNKLKNKEKKYATIGILSYLSFQIFVNVGMNLGVVPTTGIPLPFISYGGSNLIVNVLAVGLVMKFLNERSTY
jgi:rod shape determining protein RodA